MLMIASVAAGGAIGSVLRYLAGKGISSLLGMDFPYGTLLVNIVGSFIMGVLIGLFAPQINTTPEFRAFLTIGVLGGFTTFSTFSLDVVTLWERGDMVLALVYTALSIVVSIAALIGGLLLTRSFAL